MSREEHTPGPWFVPMERPEPGRKIVALYDDGSGAQLAYVTEVGFIDQNGDEQDEDWLIDHMGVWAYLPDHVRMWCELRGEDPYTFTAASPSGSGSQRGGGE